MNKILVALLVMLFSSSQLAAQTGSTPNGNNSGGVSNPLALGLTVNIFGDSQAARGNSNVQSANAGGFGNTQVATSDRNPASWLDYLSNGALYFDLSKGYGGTQFGVFKYIVEAGGTGYAAGTTASTTGGSCSNQPTISSVTVVAGVITGLVVNSQGSGCSTTPTVTLANTGGGSGAVIDAIYGGTGTLGVPGQTSTQMTFRTGDICIAAPDVLVITGPTNDAGAGLSFATTTANLTAIWQAAARCSKPPIIMQLAIFPRQAWSGTLANAPASAFGQKRINDWIRNNSRTYHVYFVDPTQQMVDTTNNLDVPIGYTSTGSSIATCASSCGTIILDGLHTASPGGYIAGNALWNVAKTIPGIVQQSITIGSFGNAYDATNNPNGNVLPGLGLFGHSGRGLATISVSASGTCTVAPTGMSVTGGAGTGMTVAPLVDGTLITGVIITNPGANYTSVPTFAQTGGTCSVAPTFTGALETGGTAVAAPFALDGSVTTIPAPMLVAKIAAFAGTCVTATVGLQAWSDGSSGNTLHIVMATCTGGTATQTFRAFWNAVGTSVFNAGDSVYARCYIAMSNVLQTTVANLNIREIGGVSTVNSYGLAQNEIFPATPFGPWSWSGIETSKPVVIQTSNPTFSMDVEWNMKTDTGSASATIDIGRCSLQKVAA